MIIIIKSTVDKEWVNYEVWEECHSKFEDPVPEEKKSIYEYEDVSCLFAWWDIDDNQS